MQSRRDWLKHLLFGAGALGLRQIATGLPAAAFLYPHRALTQDRIVRLTAAASAQYLVLSTSSWGDPVNCNCPGMYLDSNMRHPADATMVPTTISMGSVTATAAKVWNTLTPATLARTSFFHHATYQIAHASQGLVQTLSGEVTGGDMMMSAFARLLQPKLSTIQAQPLTISGIGGSETVEYQGTPQPAFDVLGLKSLLLQPTTTTAINGLQSLRDQSINALYAALKPQGSPAQLAFIDQFATSQTQARQISQSILDTLSSLTDNTLASQMQAVAVLAQMKLAPVFVTHIPFGGDNHGDPALATEVADHVSGTQAMATLFSTLSSFGLADKITFAMFNVFGRDNSTSGLGGRNHNDHHNTTVMVGANIKGGVIGGATLQNGESVATGIDPTTGASSASGAITYAQTLGSMGKTLGAALGIAQADLDSAISTGQLVPAGLA